MRQRRTEQRKDAITQGLRDIAVILMHRVHHQLQGGINNRSGFFRVESFNQGCRAFEIGKQRRDRLAFTVCATSCFQRRLFRADALGQMQRRVAQASSGGLGLEVCGEFALALSTFDLR